MGVRGREKKEGSGVFWVFVHYKGKRISRKVGSERAAKDAASKIQARLTLGKGAFPQKAKLPTPRLKDYYRQFEENYKGNLEPTTWSSYEMALRVHILPEFGQCRLDEITKPMMKKFVKKLMDKGLAKDSIRLYLASLAVLYTEAIDDKVVTENPAKKLGKFYKKAPVKHEDVEPLNEEEALLFLQKTLEFEKNYYPMFLLPIHAGLRSGEIAGLQWGDIDWNGKFLKVKRSVNRWGQVGNVKTKNAKRRVDLSDDLLRTLRDYRNQKKKEALAKGKQMPEWVFANRFGSFIDIKNVKARNFKRVIRKAELRDFHFHNLRHTFASQLLSRGVNILYVSKQLGHANPGITMKIYAEWIPKDGQREAMNKLPSLSRQRDISEEVAEEKVAV